MSVKIVGPQERDTSLTVRSAVPADHHAIREVVVAAYRQYARELTPEAYTRYLADLLDWIGMPSTGIFSSRTWADESSDQAPTTQTAPSRTLAGQAAGPAAVHWPYTRTRVVEALPGRY